MNNLARFKPMFSLLGAIVLAAGVAYFLPDLTVRQKHLTFAMLLGAYLFYEYRLVLPPVQPAQAPVPMPAQPVRPVSSPVPVPVQRPAQPAAQVVTRPDPPVEALQLGFYQKEAIVINRQLEEVYKLALAIDFRDPNAIVQTPTRIVYRTTQLGPVSLSKVERIATDLARDINTLYRQKALPREQWHQVKVVVADAQPIVFQVTRAKPHNLTWDKRPSLPPFQTCCGFYLDGWDMEPMVLDIEHADSQHAFGVWIGQQRSGKSRSMEATLGQLLTNTPTGLEVCGIDLNGRMFDKYAGVPQLKGAASTMEDALPILAMFAKWCDAQYAPADGVVRLLVIDEFHKVLAHPELGALALQYIQTIMREGGKYLLRLWAATQNPDKDNYPSALKPLTQFTLCSRIQNDLYVRNVLQIQGAADLMPKIEQLYVGHEGTLTLATFWYTDELVKETLASLRKSPVPAAQPVLAAAQPALPPADGVVRFPIPPTRGPTEAEAAEILRLVDEGKFRWNGVLSEKQVIEFVYGKGKRNEKKANFIKAVLYGQVAPESEEDDEE